MIYLVQKKDAEKTTEVKRFGYYTNLLEYMGSLGFCIGDFNEDFYMDLHDKKAATTTVSIQLPGKDTDEYQIVTINEDFREVPFMIPQMAGVNPLTAMNDIVPKMNNNLGNTIIFKRNDSNTPAIEVFDRIMKDCKTDTDEQCKFLIKCIEHILDEEHAPSRLVFPAESMIDKKLDTIIHSYHNSLIAPKHAVSAIKHIVKGEELDDDVVKVKILFPDDLNFSIISKDDKYVKAYIRKATKALEESFKLVKPDKYPDVYNKFVSNIKDIFNVHHLKDKMLEEKIMGIIEKEEVKDNKDAYANVIAIGNLLKNKDNKSKLISHVFSCSPRNPMPLLINNTFIDIIDWIDGTSKRLSSEMNKNEFDSRFKIFMEDVEILTDGRDEKRLKKIRKIIESCKEDSNTNAYRSALFKIQNLVADKHADLKIDKDSKKNSIILDSIYTDTCNIEIDNTYYSIMLYIKTNCHSLLEEKDDMTKESFIKAYDKLIDNIHTLIKGKNDPVFEEISNARTFTMVKNNSDGVIEGYCAFLKKIEEIVDKYHMAEDKRIDEVNRKRNEHDGFVTISEVFTSGTDTKPICLTIDNSYNAVTNYIVSTATALSKCISMTNDKYFADCYLRFIDNIEIICERRKEDVFKALSKIVSESKRNKDGKHFTKEDKDNYVNTLFRIVLQIQSYNKK